MKRYYLFAGEAPHIKGGINDFQGSFDTVDEAKKFYTDFNTKAKIRQNPWWDWYQIVDSTNMNVVDKLG